MLLHYRVFEVLGIGGGALGLGALQMLAVIHSVEISSLFSIRIIYLPEGLSWKLWCCFWL